MAGHKVPTHLQQPDGIGPFSMRVWGLLGAAYWLGDDVWQRVPAVGPAVGDLIRLRYEHLGIPEHWLPLGPVAATLGVVTPLLALALPVSPPPEHGLASLVGWLRQRGLHPTQDVLWSPEQVADYLGHPGLRTTDADVIESEFGVHAAWELPPQNLRLADAAAVEIAQDLWGQFLSGLSYPIQMLTTAHRVDLARLVGTLEDFAGARADNACGLAAWLRSQAIARNLIERRHFLAFYAEDEHSFADAVQQLGEGIASLGLRQDLVRRLAGDELAAVVRRTFSPRPPSKQRLGPSGPWRIAARQLQSDLEWHEVSALARWPRVIRDNALAPFLDGAYAIDVVQHITPVDAEDILDGLERRLNAMRASTPNRKRKVAIEDLERFIDALESGEEAPFDVATYFHVHHADRHEVQQEIKRLESRARRSGARLANLRWEQPAALRACSPLAVNDLKKRTVRVDTSSIKRAYPLPASTCWPEGSVPVGESLESRRPIGWTPWRRPLIGNPHLAVYANSGGGKGFAVKVIESRLLFAGATQEIYGIDQAEEDDELGEYGRFAVYCGLEYRHIRRLETDLGPALADLDNPRFGYGVIWNLAALPLRDRPSAFIGIKTAVWNRATAVPARRQLIVDELWAFARGAAAVGADPQLVALAHGAMEEVVRLGRHVQLGGIWMTQRVRDSIETPLVQVIQSQAASQLYGQQNPGEVTHVAPLLQWTEAETKAVKRLVPGNFLLVAGPWRVTLRVTASDEEFEMAHTDGRLEGMTRDQVRPSVISIGPETVPALLAAD